MAFKPVGEIQEFQPTGEIQEEFQPVGNVEEFQPVGNFQEVSAAPLTRAHKNAALQGTMWAFKEDDTSALRAKKEAMNSLLDSNPVTSLLARSGFLMGEEHPDIQEQNTIVPEIGSAKPMGVLEDPISGNIIMGGALRGLTQPVVSGFGMARAGLLDALSGATGGLSDIAMAGGKAVAGKVGKKLTQKAIMKGIRDVPEFNSLLDVPVDKIKNLDANIVRELGNKVTSNNVEEIAPYINRLADRLDQSEVKEIIQNSLTEIEQKGENKLLKELSEAVYRKDTIGKYGSISKIVNRSKPISYKVGDQIFTGRSVPVYEAELNMLKTLPLMTKKQGFYQPGNRYFDKMGKELKDLTYGRAYKAEHLKNIEYHIVKKETHDLKKSLPIGASERIGIYAVAQQKDGVEILNNMGKKIPELSDKEMKAYNSLRDRFEGLYKRLQEARISSGKKPFDKVDNYFTFFKQMEDMKKDGLNPLLASKDLIDKYIQPNAMPFKFATKRVKSKRAVELDAFDVFNKYNHSALTNIYVSPEIAKTQALRRTLQDGIKSDGKPKTFVLADFNPLADRFLNNWAKDAAGIKWHAEAGETLSTLDKISEKVNKNLVYSVLSWNFDSMIKQPLALRNTIPEIGMNNLMKGFNMNISPKWRAYALKNSSVLNTRFFESGIEEALSGTGKLKTTIGNAGITPLKFLDAETARMSWLGAFNKGIKESGNLNEAIKYADDVVIRTQGSASRFDRAPISRTPTGKMLSIFQTFAMADWNYLKTDILKIGTDETFKKGKLLKYIIATAIANKIYEDGLGMNAFPNPIKALEESAEEGNSEAMQAFDVAMELSGIHPALGGAKYGMSLGGSAVNTLTKAFNKLSQGKELDVKAFLLEAGKLTGAPGYGEALKRYNIYQKGGTEEQILRGQPIRKQKDEFNINDLGGNFNIK